MNRRVRPESPSSIRAVETKQVSIHFRIPRTVEKPDRCQLPESRGAFGGITISTKEGADPAGQVVDERMVGRRVGGDAGDRPASDNLEVGKQLKEKPFLVGRVVEVTVCAEPLRDLGGAEPLSLV